MEESHLVVDNRQTPHRRVQRRVIQSAVLLRTRHCVLPIRWVGLGVAVDVVEDSFVRLKDTPSHIRNVREDIAKLRIERGVFTLEHSICAYHFLLAVNTLQDLGGYLSS